MYYEINVSLNGSHFFATHERSITTRTKLKQVYESLLKAFPQSEGYEISISLNSVIGEFINPAEL